MNANERKSKRMKAAISKFTIIGVCVADEPHSDKSVVDDYPPGKKVPDDLRGGGGLALQNQMRCVENDAFEAVAESAQIIQVSQRNEAVPISVD